MLDAIVKEKVSVFSGVPTMYWALLNIDNQDNRWDFEAISKRWRVGVSGGASLPVEILKGIEEKYSIPIMEGYGLPETCPVAAFNHLGRERKPGSVGTPIWGVDVNILDKENSMDEAIIKPRLHCSIGGKITIEAERFKPEVVSYLEEMGYNIEKKSDFDFYFGAIHSVIRCKTKDEFQGAAEVRRDGTAGGF